MRLPVQSGEGHPSPSRRRAEASPPAAPGEQLRLLSLVARLYHVHRMRQRDIGERLGMSQARVSRVLAQAETAGLVRTVLVPAEGLHSDLEDELERRFGVAEAHVVEVPGGEEQIPVGLGAAAARYLAGAPLPGGVVGFTSWSTTLQALALALALALAGEATLARSRVTHVVELLGDLGSPVLQHTAARATQRFAGLLGAEPVFLRAPGVVASSSIRRSLLRDPHVTRALRLMDDLDVAIIGVGPPRLHRHLSSGDSYFQDDQLEGVRARGAVAELNQRFLDGTGQPVASPLDDLVIGIDLPQVRAARRRVLVAGGAAKIEPIQAALVGGWLDALITDVATAEHLVCPAAATTGTTPAGRRDPGVGMTAEPP